MSPLCVLDRKLNAVFAVICADVQVNTVKFCLTNYSRTDNHKRAASIETDSRYGIRPGAI